MIWSHKNIYRGYDHLEFYLAYPILSTVKPSMKFVPKEIMPPGGHIGRVPDYALLKLKQ